MTGHSLPSFSVKLAETQAEIEAAQHLRYEVFVEELGGGGKLVDREARLERDQFDPYCDHILLMDQKNARLAGVYRVMRQDQAAVAGAFYSASEYDLDPLLSSGRSLLELGRSCLHADYRGSMAMFHLWSALAEYIAKHHVEILFGVASFHGTDVKALAEPLAFLHHRHLAPPEIRVRARSESFQRMDLVEEARLDRRRAMLGVPSLIKSYLRLGGVVGEGAYVDHAFNTTDVCLILDTAKMNMRQARIYQGSAR